MVFREADASSSRRSRACRVFAAKISTPCCYYHDCQTDDARLVLAVLLDARARGADILNRRAVTAIEPLANGYAVEMDERGVKRRVDARFIVNAAGPFVAEIDAMSRIAPPPAVCGSCAAATSS